MKASSPLILYVFTKQLFLSQFKKTAILVVLLKRFKVCLVNHPIYKNQMQADSYARQDSIVLVVPWKYSRFNLSLKCQNALLKPYIREWIINESYHF